jgi:hypothetical protein
MDTWVFWPALFIAAAASYMWGRGSGEHKAYQTLLEEVLLKRAEECDRSLGHVPPRAFPDPPAQGQAPPKAPPDS